VDYLGWELERQRAALAALLLGGGDGKASREEERRSPAGPGTAWERAAGGAGRYAKGPGGDGGLGDILPGGRAAVHGAGADDTGTVEAPENAWGQPAGEASGRDGLDGETDVPAGPRRTAGREALLGGGTGAREGASPGSGGHRDREKGQGTAAGQGKKQAAEPAEEPVRGRTAELTAGQAKRRTAGQAIGQAAESVEAAAGTAGKKRAAGPSAEEVFVPSDLSSETGDRGGYAAGGSAVRRANRSMAGYRAGAALSGGKMGTSGQDEMSAASVPWVSSGETADLRAEDSAKSLSRAVQRDARRYDGGFYIY